MKKLIRVRQDWFGEWRFYLFNRRTSLCWMDPREWGGAGWWCSCGKTTWDHGIYRVRLLGFDYHWFTK